MDASPRYPGVSIMITRRVHNRAFRLRPSAKTNGIVSYVVAVLVAHYKLELNALMTMSTHYHARFFDPFGRASDFARDCHAFIAKLVIAAYGEEDESLWSPVSTNYVEDDQPNGAIGQIAYIMSNPVTAGLVKRVKDWPGAKGRWPQRERVIKQPPRFFQEDRWSPEARTASGRPKIHWAKTATLKFTRPRGCGETSDNELALALHRAIEVREEAAHKRWNGVAGAFPGKRAALRVSRRKRTESHEPKRGSKRIPSIRSLDRERRIERLNGLREWRVNYRACMAEWPTNRRVVFPYGTNKMRAVHGVSVDEAPT